MDNNISKKNQNIQESINITLNKSPKKVIKVLNIIGGIVVGIAFLLISVYRIISSNFNKLICKSKEGNITLLYNRSTINGYITSNMNYDLHGQKAIAEQIGIKNYIVKFKTWFETNTTGTCIVKEK